METLKAIAKDVAKRPPVMATFAGVVFVVVAGWYLWAGNDVTLEAIWVPTIIGITIGSLYAMYATGLVVVYNTTGVFNFAQAAIGTLSAFLYWELHVNRGIHTIPSIVLVLIMAALLGVLLDMLIMRRLKALPLVVQLMVTVAVMVLLLSLTADIWQADKIRNVDFFFGNNGFRIGGINILWHRFIVFVTAGAIAISLRLFLYRSRMGIAMRSVVDNKDLAALNGARPNVISSYAWAMGSVLAALGGILIAPELQMDPVILNSLVIIAFAGASFGGIRSLPWAFAGSLLLGLLSQHANVWLRKPAGLSIDIDFPLTISAIALFLVVLSLPQARLEVSKIATNLKSRERLTMGWEAVVGSIVLFVVVLALSGGWLNFGFWDPAPWSRSALLGAVVAMALPLVGLSLVPLTGWAGQINFAPMAFAGFGAFVYFKFAGDSGFGSIWWLFLVALLSAPVGAMVALFAARLKGLYLALASLAFFVIMTELLFPNRDILPPPGSNTETYREYPYLSLFGWEFDGDRAHLMLMVAVFGIFVSGLVFLRRSRFGRRWTAMNDSQAASATVGVNVPLTKVAVYALSAAMAGVAGAFWAIAYGNVDGIQQFEILDNLGLVLLMAAAGISIPVAGLFLTFQFIFGSLEERLRDTGSVDWLVTILDKMVTYGPGLLAIAMVVNQRGAIYEMGKGFAPMLPWRKDAREELRLENEQKREFESGQLGLGQVFTADAVIDLDKKLGITEFVIPDGGYASPDSHANGSGNGAAANPKQAQGGSE